MRVRRGRKRGTIRSRLPLSLSHMHALSLSLSRSLPLNHSASQWRPTGESRYDACCKRTFTTGKETLAYSFLLVGFEWSSFRDTLISFLCSSFVVFSLPLRLNMLPVACLHCAVMSKFSQPLVCAVFSLNDSPMISAM